MADDNVEAAFLGSTGAAEQPSNQDSVLVNGEAHIEDDDEYEPQDSELPSGDTAAEVPAETPALNLNTTTSAPSSAAATPTPQTIEPQQTTTSTMVAQPPRPTSTVAALPKARLPHDRIGILEDRIADDEKGDLQAWLELVQEYRNRGKLDEVRKVYDRFFEVFPFAADEYENLIQLENEAGNKQKVEAIFGKILSKMPSLKAWSLYLNHVRRYFNISVDRTGKASQTVHAAYNAVLDHVGGDSDAGGLWQDYLAFVKSGPGVVGGSSWQDGQKMDVLRKAYQQAVITPHQEIEVLWREYTSFELGINKQTASKFLRETSESYMIARSAFAELKRITAGLTKTSLPRLPPAPGFDGHEEYMQQVDLWQRWINWERNDPLVLKEGNAAGWRKRVIYVYKQALMALYFWPELWLEAAEFCFDNDQESQGNDFLAQGIAANPESALLAFRQADRLELSTTNGNDDDSKEARGQKVREPYDNCLDALYALVTKTQSSEASQIAQIEAEAASNGASPVAAPGEDDNDETADIPEVAEARRRRQERIDGVKSFSKGRMDQLCKTITYVWVALMRSFQRMQGKGKPGGKILGSRGIFADARKRGRLTSELYSAAALLEYHSGEKDPGSRIFERGTKLFPKDEIFALDYIKFLVLINDTTNARVVFETTVSRIQGDADAEVRAKAKPLFAYFRKFEAQYGELSQVMKLEDRMRAAFPEDQKLWSFSARFVDPDGLSNFDVTAVHQIISPGQQAKPRSGSYNHVTPATAMPIPSPQIAHTNTNTTVVVNSPKRSLPEEFSEATSAPAPKVARGESPLKGAAGRRMAAQASAMSSTPITGHTVAAPIPQVVAPPALAPLPSGVNYLLGIIPPASTYNATRLNADSMVRLIQGLHVPMNVEELRSVVASRQQPQQQQYHHTGGMSQQGQQQYWQGPGR